MIILGIDPGYAIVGFGVIEKDRTGKCKVIDYGTIETHKTEKFADRLSKIYDGIKVLIAKYKPDAVALEELFFNNNITTGIAVAEARGVIIVALIQECVNLFEYTPLQIKQAMTGNGRAEKQQVQYMTRMILNLKTIPKPDDAADALAVALTCAQTNNILGKNNLV
ncbi:MAG: crossover junction endodeoxyribonuclease RuvC [Clostridia bacterium]